MPRKRGNDEATTSEEPKRMKQTTLTRAFVKEENKSKKDAETVENPNKATEKTRGGTLSDVRSFLDHVRKICPAKPLEAFVKLNGAVLCGYFQRIGGGMEDKDETEIRMHCRHPTDLPEMMTCCEYEGGRYAIWRDDPSDSRVLFVHVPNEEHFPAIQVVGDRFEHVLYHLGGKDPATLRPLLPEGTDLQKLYKDSQEVVKQRNKTKLGNLPNGVGIWVAVKHGLGYRDLGISTAELKKTLTAIGSADNYNVRKKAEDRLTELCAHATMANDEMDFGAGLELGHWLWLANYRALNKRAKQFLVCAYNLLERGDYADIVKDHFEKREADAQKKLEENIKAAAASLKK